MKYRFRADQKAIITKDRKNKSQDEINRGIIPNAQLTDYLARRRGANVLEAVMTCGFECGNQNSLSRHGHWQTTSAMSYSSSVVRSGQYALRFYSNSNQSGSAVAYREASPPFGNWQLSDTVMVWRVYLYFVTLPNVNTNLMGNFGTNTLANGLIYNVSDGKLYCGYGTQAQFIGASGVSVTTGQWYKIDCYWDQTSGARVFRAKVDGVSLGESTTAGIASRSVPLALGSSRQCDGEWYFDDFVLSFTANNYPIADGKVYAFVPNEDGTHNITQDFRFFKGATANNITNATTDSYQLIDEVPMTDITPVANDFIAQTTDSATDYVEHNFDIQSGVTMPTKAPRCLDIIVAYHQQNTGTGNCSFKLVDNGTENTIKDFNGAGVTNLTYFAKAYSKAPTDNTQWTLARLNALKHRFGYSSDATPHQYFDGVMIEAEFPPES